MAQCLMCEKVGWFRHDVCEACIPAVKKKSVKYSEKLENNIKFEKITKDPKKCLAYCKDIIDIGERLYLLYKAVMPGEAKKLKKTIFGFVDKKYNIEWDMTKVTADKLMKRAKTAVTLEGRLNFTKKALIELRRLKKIRPEHRKNAKLIEYIDSCEIFVKNEQLKDKKS